MKPVVVPPYPQSKAYFSRIKRNTCSRDNCNHMFKAGEVIHKIGRGTSYWCNDCKNKSEI